jgi:transcriptional regulator with XRE-family HTH domain
MTRGEKLKKLRKDVDRTLEEVGNAVNISKQNLYKYENDLITNIPSDKIEALAEYYMVSPSYIMGWEIEKTETGYTINDGKDEMKIELIDATKDLTEKQIRELINYAKFIIQERSKDETESKG